MESIRSMIKSGDKNQDYRFGESLMKMSEAHRQGRIASGYDTPSDDAVIYDAHGGEVEDVDPTEALQDKRAGRALAHDVEPTPENIKQADSGASIEYDYASDTGEGGSEYRVAAAMADALREKGFAQEQIARVFPQLFQ